VKDLASIEDMLRRRKPSVLKEWLQGQNLHIPGAAHRMDPDKTHFVKLNEQGWCKREKTFVGACELGCFAWLPKGSSK